MSDDMWRRADDDNGRRGRDEFDDTGDSFDDFGELTFADDSDDTSTGIPRPVDPTPRVRPGGAPRRPVEDFSGEIDFADDASTPIRFGPSDTGPLPHWTEPPTGDLPRIFAGDEPTGSSRGKRRDDSSGARRSPRGRDADDSDVDIWGTYSGAAPRPVIDEPAPRRRRDVPTDEIQVRSSRDDSGSGMFDDVDDDFGDLSFGDDDTSTSMARPSADPSSGRPRVKLGEPAPGARAERGSGPLRRPDLSSASGVSTTPMPATRRNQPPRDPSLPLAGFDDLGFDDSGFGGSAYDDFGSGARGRPGRPEARGGGQESGDASRGSGRGRSRPVIGDDTFGDASMERMAPDDRGRSPRDPRAARGPGGPGPRGPGEPRDPRRGGPVAPPGGTSGRDMPSAIAVGLLLAAVFIGALMWKPVAVLAIVVLVTGLASIEFFDKVTEKGYRPASIVGIIMAVASPLAAYWVGDSALPLVMVFALIAAGTTFVGATGLNSNPLPNMAISTLGMVWIGLTGSYGALLAGASNTPFLPHIGTDTLLMVAVGVVANDVGALFVGSAAGSTPLRAWISPNKTTEGLMGGTVATFLSMWVVGLQSDTWNDISEIVILAIAVAVLAPLGDLFESMLKRNLEVKDFGALIKGHGGVLDRFDGFLFVLPAAYYLLMVLEPYATS